MTRTALLLDNLARARRFANAVSAVEDRERFEAMAAEFQRELDALKPAESLTLAAIAAAN